MTQQARLDLLGLQRLTQQRVLLQIDLADREVVGGIPVTLHPLDELVRQRPGSGFLPALCDAIVDDRAGDRGVKPIHGWLPVP